MSRRKETRQERTQRFRDEVNEAYFHRIVDFVDKYKDELFTFAEMSPLSKPT